MPFSDVLQGLTLDFASSEELLSAFDNVGYLAAGYLVTGLVHRYYVRYKAGPTLPLPPQAPPKGTHGQLAPADKLPYLFYQDYAKKLNSDIIHVPIGRDTLILLNSLDAATSVLEKRSSLYYNRTHDSDQDITIHDSKRWNACVRGMLLPQLLCSPGETLSVVKRFGEGMMTTGPVGSTTLKALENGDLRAPSDLGSCCEGGDTIVAVMKTFFLAISLRPEVQNRAHAEINGISGKHRRLPVFADRHNLPYVTAVMREVLRWQPPSPVSSPYTAKKEDEYNGYRIPAGGMVIANIWAILHDEIDYPDPSAFKPERFIHPDGRLNKMARDPTSIVFGFGRSSCPGKDAILSTLWTTIASVLAGFYVERDTAGDGRDFTPEMAYLADSDKSLRVRTRVRSVELAALIRNEQRSLP